MSDTVITVIGAVVGVAGIGVMVAVVVFFWKMATTLQSSHVDSLAKAAAAHGWQFEHASEIGQIERQWSGTTDGVAWNAIHRGISNESADNSHRRHSFRWRTSLANGPASPLVLIHERAALHGVDEKTKELPGFMRGLVSTAIDHVASVHFGPEAADVNLSAWSSVDGHGLPGMRVLAPVADGAALAVCQRIAPAIARESAALGTGGIPPSILIRHDALHLASPSDTSAADVERAVALGVGIAQALSAR